MHGVASWVTRGCRVVVHTCGHGVAVPPRRTLATVGVGGGSAAGGAGGAASNAVAPDGRRLSPTADPLLYTPGPLTTSPSVKAAMMHDYGSRDSRFLTIVQQVRSKLTAMVGGHPSHECVIMQGSGTFAVESMIGTLVPRSGAKLLVVANGAYGLRMNTIATVLGIPTVLASYDERRAFTVKDVSSVLAAHPEVTHVAVVHHETTAGVLNPIHALGTALQAQRPGITYLVDSMSAMGAYPVDVAASHIHAIVSSSNKCIEGVPGFAYAIVDRDRLAGCKGVSRSVALDLHAQWANMQSTQQFRFTPPTHSLAAFHQALVEHEAEGGCAGRLARYESNFRALKAGMAELGFHLYVPEADQGCIISTFLWPDHAKFDFSEFYSKLASAGFVIYPGKLTHANCFRIGSIGKLYRDDIVALVDQVRIVLNGMGVPTPVTQIKPEA